MANLNHCWTVACQTCGDVDDWTATHVAPSDCPNDAGHTVDSVAFKLNAAPEIHLSEPGGKVFKLEVDGTGTLSTTEV